jgi:hypothetical protein
MDRSSWASVDVDLEHASVARVYDYNLGGSHNFAVDRQKRRRTIEMWPDYAIWPRRRYSPSTDCAVWHNPG